MSTYPFLGKKLMTPGPVPLPEEVRNSLAAYECHHRSKEFAEILARVFENLKSVFKTTQPCLMLAGTGTGGLEAAMINTMRTDKKSLFINSGKFGDRWGKIAKAYGIPYEEIQMEWGSNVDLDLVRDTLKKGGFQALAFQACETSTGSLQPAKELAAICQEQDVLSVIDGITALGAAPLPMDEWGLDVVVGGSQKAFMIPTGMSFVSLSERAQGVERNIPSYYYDLKAETKACLDGKTRYSTPTHFVIALDLVLDKILNKVGFDQHLKNIAEKAQFFRDEVGLELYPQTPSPSLTCMKVPEGVSATEVKNNVFNDGYIIVAGQDQLKDKVLRVGHMGDISKEELAGTAKAIKQYI